MNAEERQAELNNEMETTKAKEDVVFDNALRPDRRARFTIDHALIIVGLYLIITILTLITKAEWLIKHSSDLLTASLTAMAVTNTARRRFGRKKDKQKQ